MVSTQGYVMTEEKKIASHVGNVEMQTTPAADVQVGEAGEKGKGEQAGFSAPSSRKSSPLSSSLL